MKRMVALAAGICLAAGAVCVPLIAEAPALIVRADAVSGSCGISVTYDYNTATKHLNIKGSGDMFVYDGVNAVPGWTVILKTCSIQNGVTSVGNCAFLNNGFMTAISLSATITKIGKSAFEGCTSLTSIKLPEKLEIIDDRGFEGCGLITDVTIPGGVTYVGKEAFANCINLTKLTINEGVREIGESAFIGDTSLAGVSIPPSVTAIGDKAFGYDSSGEPVRGFTVYGQPGSAAAEYAAANGFAFTAADEYGAPVQNGADYTVAAGETVQLSVEGWTRETEWLSGDTSVAEVSADGTVRGLSSGTVTVYALTGDTVHRYTLEVTGESVLPQYGDINLDGLVDALDATVLLQYYAHVSTGGTDTLEEYLGR